MSHLGELLSTYLDGELSAGEHRRVASHLAGCEACRMELDHVSVGRGLARSLPTLELPVIDAAAFTSPPSVVRRRGRSLALAGAAAVLLALAGVAATLDPTPQQISAPALVQAHLARSPVPGLTPGGLASVTNASPEGATP